MAFRTARLCPHRAPGACSPHGRKRRGDIDRFDLRVADQLEVVSVRARDAKLVGKTPGRLLGAGTDREQFGVGQAAEGVGKLAGDFSGSKNSPTQAMAHWIAMAPGRDRLSSGPEFGLSSVISISNRRPHST